MTKSKILLLSVFTFILISACSSGVRTHSNPGQAMTYIKSNMEFLASDDLQGRDVASFGGYAAGQFLVNQLKQYGIKPYAEDGYFQNFVVHSTSYKGSRITLHQATDVDSLRFLEDYYIYYSGDSAANSPVVFVGYGLIDSANNINDYENIDVRDKTVLVLRGVPKGYEGNRGAGWTRTKSRTAQAQRAVGCLTVYPPSIMKTWQAQIKGASVERVGRGGSSKEINTILPDSFLVKKIVNMPEKSYADIWKALDEGAIEKGTELSHTISWQVNKTITDHTARNIIGLLEGTDPSLKNEFVTFGAHYDHEGIKNGQVYNGADDNASGTVTVLECARQLALNKQNKRPILFCFWDGEEKGLLGSSHYTTTHPDIQEIVVNINLDMIGRGHEDTLIVIGSGKVSSEFFNIVEDANKQSSNFVFDYSYDEENHPLNLFRRSDQWSFAKFDVPVVFVTNNDNPDYHKPIDDADKINYLKLSKVSDWAVQTAIQVANLGNRLKIDNANISGMDVK